MVLILKSKIILFDCIFESKYGKTILLMIIKTLNLIFVDQEKVTNQSCNIYICFSFSYKLLVIFKELYYYYYLFYYNSFKNPMTKR
jgi:hypothetical protein